MKEARAKLLYDHAIVGNGVPMVSCSQKNICLNDVVHTIDYDFAAKSYHQEKAEVTSSITAWRVIQINYKERYYRIRDGGGCEMSIHHSDGCPHFKTYHTFNEARAKIVRGLIECGVDEKRKAEAHAIEHQENMDAFQQHIEDVVPKMEEPKPPAPIKLAFSKETISENS